jgi:hypothetical protein
VRGEPGGVQSLAASPGARRAWGVAPDVGSRSGAGGTTRRPSGRLVAVSDPVSWLMIRPGWKVLAADGSDAGRVDEVAGDDGADIFDGLAIAETTFGKPRYVPAEQVAEITDGAVRLSLTRQQVEQLGEYLEPASSEEIEPDDRAGLGGAIRADVRELEGRLLAPTQRHEHRLNVWRRIAFVFLRRRGR